MGINPGNPAFALPPGEDSLVRQIKDLERTTRENLASVVNSFKTTVADLQSVLAAQVLPKVATGTGDGFIVTGSFQTFATATLLVPEGYTRALVVASGQVTAGNDADMGIQKLYAHTTINGSAGDDSTVSMAGVLWGTAPAFGSSTLSGLAGGDISVGIAGRVTTGFSTDPTSASWDNATLAVQALFLR